MTTDEVLQILQPWRQRWARHAWKPVTEEREGSVMDSKFGGAAWLSPEESWPECPVCRNAMPLFLQLDLDMLPDKQESEFGTGLLQLFYCTHCDAEGNGAWEPFSKSSLVRVVQPGPASAEITLLISFPSRTIVGWQKCCDHPDPEDHPDLGLFYEYDFGYPPVITVICDDPDIDADVVDDDELAEKISSANRGDKLGGWPHWIQNAEYPMCPQCQRTMRLVFQLDSEDNLPFMFGDMGTGHITQCPVHQEVVAFGWAGS